jgi:hypothetical protein
LDQQPSFKQLLARNCCLIPADGFFEWRRVGRGKIPMRVRIKDQKPFTMPGLWDLWRDPDGEELYSFTIITTPANQLLQLIHNRHAANSGSTRRTTMARTKFGRPTHDLSLDGAVSLRADGILRDFPSRQ